MSRPLISIFGIPVTISPWHLLWMLLLFSGQFEGPNGITLGLSMILIATASILGHELGHGLTAKAFALEPEVYLVSLGGFTRHLPARRPRDEFLIVAAGPTMNFAIAAAASLLRSHPNPLVATLAHHAMGINIVWGVYNLLPVWPMDGGQLLRILLTKLTHRVRAERWTHLTGIVVGGLMALVVLVYLRWIFAAVFLLMTVFQNWQMLRAVEDSPDAKAQGAHPRVRELLGLARTAYGQGDFAAASRYAHQARSEPYLSQVELEHVWQMLALCAARERSYEEALRFAERVPRSADMALVQAHALAALGDAGRIRRFLATPAALLLPQERVGELQEMARQLESEGHRQPGT